MSTTGSRRLLTYLLIGIIAAPWANSAAAVDLANPGAHAVGFFDLNVPRPGSGSFGARLFYPATMAGVTTPFDPSGGPYPVVSFGHGYLQEVSRYTSTLSHLASHGYFVIAPTGHTGLFPDQPQFAADMSTGLDYMVAQGANPSSMFFGGVDPGALAVSGHSMGGAASIRVAATNPQVAAVANLAAANITNPSPIDLMADVTVPVNLIAGSDDLISPPHLHQIPMYNNGQPPKMLTTFEGGSHAYFQDSGPTISDGSTLPRSQQLAHTRRELTTFFNFYLKEDESLWREVWGPEAFADPIVTVTADSGISVVPDVTTMAVLPGQTATYNVTITNNGRDPAYFDLFAEDQAWNTSFSVGTTPVLSPGQSALVSVEVTPPSTAFGATDQVLISARTSADGLTRGWTMLETVTPAFESELAVASFGTRSVLAFDTAGVGTVFADASDGLFTPFDVAYAANGDLFVADFFLNSVRRFDTAGNAAVFANALNGVHTPTSLAFGPDGSLFVANYLPGNILRLDASGNGTLFVDSSAGLQFPFGLAVDADGNVYVTDFGNNRVVKFDPAGNATVLGDSSDGLFTPFGVAIGPDGDVFVSNVLNSRIVRFAHDGTSSIFLEGSQGIAFPAGLAFDALGNLFVGNLNDRIFMVSPSGDVSLYADASDGLVSPFGMATRLLSTTDGIFGAAAFASQVVSVPEPSTLLLGLMGLAALVIGSRRRVASAHGGRDEPTD